MTKETLIAHVKQAIEKASAHASWIDASILDLNGFSTGVQRRLVNNLVHLPKADPVYLECGLWKGSSFCAAINNSPTLHAYGVEDFSQPFAQNNVKEELEANVERYKSGARSVTVFNADCFKLDLDKIDRPVDVFYFDGEHSYESQFNALRYYLYAMADLFVFMVDDFQWVPVSTGTRDSLESLKDSVTVEQEWILSDGVPDGPNYHNGVAVFVISKKK